MKICFHVTLSNSFIFPSQRSLSKLISTNAEFNVKFFIEKSIDTN